jgi:hypothetical protein
MWLPTRKALNASRGRIQGKVASSSAAAAAAAAAAACLRMSIHLIKLDWLQRAMMHFSMGEVNSAIELLNLSKVLENN